MKTIRNRKAISQSLDLFIIIAAVLGIGGIVTGAAYTLANSAATSASIQIVQAATAGGSATSINAFSITVKNTGTSTINCSTSVSCEVIIQTAKQGSTAVTSPTPTGSTSSGTSIPWSVLGTASSPVTFAASPMTLPPGGQASLVEGTLTLSTGGTGYVTGTVVTVNVVFGAASAQINIIAQ